MQNIKTQKLLAVLLVLLGFLTAKISNDSTFLIVTILLFCPIFFEKERKKK